MSTAAVADMGAPAKKGGKKKLMIIVGGLVVVLLAAAGGGVYVLKSRAAHAAAAAAAEDGGEEVAVDTHKAGKPDRAHPPSFLPLDPFVVNLADKDADRYAQIGIVLEVDDAVFGEQMKAFMPAIRSSILLILSRKSARDLLETDGKEMLAAEIQREVVRPLGIDISAPPPKKMKPKDDAMADGKSDTKSDMKSDDKGESKAEGKSEKSDKSDAKDDDDDKPKKVRKNDPHNPVRHVLFSNFIIQ